MMTLMGIDLSTLSLEDALDLAILIEEEARERYDDLADHLELHYAPDAAQFFRKMARSEEKHRREIADRRAALPAGDAPRVTRWSIFEIEAPDLAEVQLFMGLRDALHVALRCERKAYGFYSQAVCHVRDPEAAALFVALRNEEIEHQALVLAELEKLPSESASHTTSAPPPGGMRP